MGKIESVIFDWGGVLIDHPASRLTAYCAEVLGVPKGGMRDAQAKSMADFQKGIISEDVFWKSVCGELSVPIPTNRSLWTEAFKAAYVPRHEMFSLARRLHANGCKTALLSNTEAPAMQYFGELKYDMFDVLVFSCAEGVRKPGRRIYEIAIEKLDSPPGQTVFIDDNPKFTAGANQAGLNTILFETIGQVKNELANLGIGADSME